MRPSCRRVGPRRLLACPRLGTIVAAVVLLVTPVSAAADVATALADEGVPLDVAVEIEPTSSSVVLGDSLDLHIVVTNEGATAASRLVLHIDILDPDSGGSVDPEDWTSTLTRTIAELPPGGTTEVSWTVQPISPGTFTAYAVVVRSSGAGISASNVAEVTVEDQRSLNPGNILPLCIAAPMLIGGALVLQLRAGRRTGLPERIAAAGR